MNGSLLRQYIDKDISICVSVESTGDRNIQGKTSDGQSIKIEMSSSSDSNVPIGQWIEVIGTASGPATVQGKEVNSILSPFM